MVREACMEAYVQLTVPEHLDSRCATAGLIFKENSSTLPAACAAVGDQRCGIGSRSLLEDCFAAECATDRAAVVYERTAVHGSPKEYSGARGPNAAIVDENTVSRRRVIEEKNATVKVDGTSNTTVVRKCAIRCGRTVVKFDCATLSRLEGCDSVVSKRATSCR